MSLFNQKDAVLFQYTNQPLCSMILPAPLVCHMGRIACTKLTIVVFYPMNLLNVGKPAGFTGFDKRLSARPVIFVNQVMKQNHDPAFNEYPGS
jgi:hypothetical protein